MKQLNTGILMNHVVYFEFLFFQFSIKFNGSANLNHGTQNTKFLKKQGPRKEEGRSYITVNTVNTVNFNLDNVSNKVQDKHAETLLI